MVRQGFAAKPTRHRLLGGFVRRIAQGGDADAFALRGGMLVRHWFPASRRPARDVDLVCSLPYDVRAMRALFARTLAHDAGDGVVFEADRFRIDRIQTATPHPGMRLFAVGRVDGVFGEISIDTTFAMPIWPDAVRDELRIRGGDVPFWLCPREMLVGRKLQVLAELGPQRWRPKDLCDVWMIVRGEAPSGRLGEAIERAFAGHDHAPLEDVLARSFWTDRTADVRWSRFVGQLPRGVVPARADVVAAEVRGALRAFTGKPET
ncbi:MAG TPA: nucleotidyl transferase AbiEii/AbiGii toxin family protein [Kofleriaceae bacterium]|nr:nucleotidyl transferase AbiEii/AbiGii toxin family protein [Kofleriaceae bacterium]